VVNVAVTDFAASIVTLQGFAVPVHAPLQEPKEEPPAGVAVSVTMLPSRKLAEHVLPQSMPAGVLVTTPVPRPPVLTVRVRVWAVNVADTLLAAVIATEQEPVPVHAPLQPENAYPAAGVAVRPTFVPCVNKAEHVPPQEMPAGLLVTVPVDAPLVVTVSV
jgi:hypothetical protein